MLTNSNVQMLACFSIIGSIASITRELINYIKAYVKTHFTFQTEKITMAHPGLENNVPLMKRKILVNTIL